MSNQFEITTFQFLEEIQNEFLKDSGDAAGDVSYDTRRLINFLNDSAKLHIIASPTAGSNGHVDVLATIALENVAQRGDHPTFSVKISAKPFEKTYKQLSITYDNEALKTESAKILGTLKDALSAANPSGAEGSGAGRRARGAGASGTPTSDDAGAGSSRIRRRSLRSRDSSAEET